MKIEIPITEVQEFLSDTYNIKVGLKNIGEDKIKATYYVSLVFTIKEVGKDEVVIHYEVNSFVALLAKGAHFLLGKKLEDTPVEWDSKTSDVVVDLKKVRALSDFLKIYFISELHFVNENIVFILNTIEDTK